jgi:ribonucleoside-diphosphate reductase alpha chain
MKIINDTAHEYSCKLIEEGRELPEAWYGSTFEDKGIKIRNLSLTSGQPTGATQIIMDEICSSAGIESFFAMVYKRNIRGQEYILTNSLFKEIGINEGWFNDKVKYAILDNNGSCQNIKEVPKKWQELFKTASEVHWEDHVKMQAELQKVTTNALSKTINMPQNATIEDVYNSYMMAFDLGCKGTTVYIQNSRDGQVLTSEKIKKPKEYVPIKPIIEVADAKRLKVKTGCGSIWLMLIYDDENNLCEIFSDSGSKGGCTGMTRALSRMTSLGLRANIDPMVLVEQLQSVGCDVSKDKRKKDKEIGISCADGIGRQILKFINGDFNNTNSSKYIQEKEIDISQNDLYKCDECGEFTLTKYDGCIECTNCGWRRCR